MTKRLVGWFLLVPLSVLLVLFALANRQIVYVSLDPFGYDSALLPSFEVPLFGVVYAMLLVGVMLGGLAVWFTQGRHRRERKLYRREADRLGRELDGARRQNRQQGPKGLPETDDLLEIE